MMFVLICIFLHIREIQIKALIMSAFIYSFYYFIFTLFLGVYCVYMTILSIGIEESMEKSRALGLTPASTRLDPSIAIMAPLSVQSEIRGTRISRPCCWPLARSACRSCELALNPPPTIRVLFFIEFDVSLCILV